MDLLSGSGRAGRLAYLLTSLAISLVLVVAVLATSDTEPFTGELQPTLETYVVVVFGMYLQLMNIVRRLRDLGHRWYWVIIGVIPVLGVLFALYLLFAPGIPSRGPGGMRRPGSGPPPPVGEPLIDERAAREAHNQQFLTDDGSFDMDGLYRDSPVRRD